jgi:hypothetical protein
MKLSEQITRRQLFVAFGSTMQSGGLSSVDLAATRDPDRVILTASDGSAAPVEGANPAAAGVMTAADKAKLDGLPPASFREFAARPEIASAVIGAGITHLRTAGYAAAGDGGAALYRRAGAAPSHALKVQSADGAWWEIVPDKGAISFIACGGIAGDNPANGAANVAAFNAFIGYARTLMTGENTTGQYVGGATLVFPQGHYHFSTHLNVKAICHIRGPGGGGGPGLPEAAAVLEFPANSHGLIVHRHNTIDGTVETPASTYGDGSVIEGLALKGGGAGNTTGHGIWLRARALIRNCFVSDFAENGINIVASSGAGGAAEGNANSWRIEHVQSRNNGRHGIHVDGADANAGVAILADVRDNGRWGVLDSSFLGNTWIACHSDGNGLGTKAGNAGKSSVVTQGGNRYAAHRGASEAQLVATTPGTNKAVWIDLGAGGTDADHPAWLAAQPEGTYFAGGAYSTDNANARNVFLGCYNEPGQGPAQFVSPTFAAGGLLGDNKGSGVQFNVPDVIGGMKFRTTQSFPDNSFVAPRDLNFEVSANPKEVTRYVAGGDDARGIQMYWEESRGLWTTRHGSAAAYQQTWKTNLADIKYGRAATGDIPSGSIAFPQGLWIGDASGTSLTSLDRARHQRNGTAAPTTGAWARGDIVWNRDAASGGPLGWICTAAGTPGTWVEIRGAGTRQPHIADPAGGATIDAEARNAINGILQVLEHFGFTASA